MNGAKNVLIRITSVCAMHAGYHPCSATATLTDALRLALVRVPVALHCHESIECANQNPLPDGRRPHAKNKNETSNFRTNYTSSIV
eukprot:scaffold76091_cov19-Prasinocladus_malaysianus.AAC.1